MHSSNLSYRFCIVGSCIGLVGLLHAVLVGYFDIVGVG